MLNEIKKVLAMGIRIASLTKKEAEKEIKHLAEVGLITPKEGKELLRIFVNEARREQERIKDFAKQELKREVKKAKPYAKKAVSRGKDVAREIIRYSAKKGRKAAGMAVKKARKRVRKRKKR